jgi:hypothetical protein
MKLKERFDAYPSMHNIPKLPYDCVYHVIEYLPLRDVCSAALSLAQTLIDVRRLISTRRNRLQWFVCSRRRIEG